MLTYIQSESRELSQLQTRWKSELDPLLALSLVNGVFVKSVVVVSGPNVINHKLGRKPQGFFITDINAAITLYRSQPLNPLTLTLTSSGSGTIDLYVF